MVKKEDKEPTPVQRRLMSRAGLDPDRYQVLYDFPHSMLIRDKQTRQPILIDKDKFQNS